MAPHDTSDAGFTIIESLMALVIVSVVFVTLTTGLQLAIRQEYEQRTRLQAGSLALDEIEGSRALAWDELELATTPPAGTPHTDGVTVTGADFDLAADELLVVGPGADGIPGAVEAVSVAAVTLDAQQFDIYRYITESGTDVRRVIIEVAWTSRGVDRTFWTTTQIARLGAS